MSSFNLSPAIRIFCDTTTPPREITATSVIPPPISTIKCPFGSFKSKPLPIAMAKDFSIKYTSLTPALWKTSSTAFFSTSVQLEGTPTTALFTNQNFPALLPSLIFCNK
jgi:hypothetical protein